ncbi:hypothetical protein BJF93_08780 [Xaviernesmea oryzae]|uniref:Type II toxin-antitoxin system antitoxin, RelB/DinJ family n=1 Tax=Xaviernesmea oryzae TaxID=464029 RepID=A0A1Q9B127_9HYPH|nr:type II toxin-antitoxin system RelB/DinJ family antitoxin [Xaviernesmea oryzae]OLP61685.1 hypothetical protein BJF93_08780 [Xaviernesmea oryzae]
MLHIRIEDDLREDAAAVFSSLGLSMSEAVRLFLHRAVASQGLPLELKVPNAATRSALREAREMRKARRARFATPEALVADLNTRENSD